MRPIYIDGEAIRRSRRARQMSQQRLGDLIGLSRTSVVHIEAGDQLPSLLGAKNLAAVLGMSMDELVHFADEPHHGTPAGAA